MHGVQHEESSEESPQNSNNNKEEDGCFHTFIINISKWINITLSWIVRLYSFPWFLNIFITRNMDRFVDIDRFCIAIGIIINTTIIFTCVHVYGVLDKIYPVEIGIWSSILILACCLGFDNYIDQKGNFAEENAFGYIFAGALGAKSEEEERECLRNAQKFAKKTKDARVLDEEYDHAIWWFLGAHDDAHCKGILKTLKERKDPYGPYGDFLVIHFVLISIFVGISAGYIAFLVIDVVNGKQLISTYSDFYTISALLIANIYGGYGIVSKWSLRYLKYVHVEESDDESQANDDRSDDDIKHDEDDD